MKSLDDIPRYRPLPRRRRLLLMGVAVAAALLVLWVLMQYDVRRLQAEAARRAATPAPCAPGQTQGCVGGVMAVVPAAPRASEPAR